MFTTLSIPFIVWCAFPARPTDKPGLLVLTIDELHIAKIKKHKSGHVKPPTGNQQQTVFGIVELNKSTRHETGRFAIRAIPNCKAHLLKTVSMSFIGLLFC